MSAKTAPHPGTCQPGATALAGHLSATGASALAGRRLRFAGGVPGFSSAKAWRAEPWGPQPNPFWLLECEDLPGLRFVAVSPAVFFPSYDPAFGPETYQAVDASRLDELTLLVILTLQRRPEDTTANLLGPIVFNVQSGAAVQAVLSGSGLSPQARLFPKREG
jgi:flagellar assembly factor FliW